MNLRIAYRSLAIKEFENAIIYYEEQRPGVGRRFEAEVREIIRLLQQNPFVHPPVCDDIRQAVLNRFPYCVYYRVIGDRLVILSVFHTRRNPNIWQRRR